MRTITFFTSFILSDISFLFFDSDMLSWVFSIYASISFSLALSLALIFSSHTLSPRVSITHQSFDSTPSRALMVACFDFSRLFDAWTWRVHT